MMLGCAGMVIEVMKKSPEMMIEMSGGFEEEPGNAAEEAWMLRSR
jgi:hypothetical protein